jgi:rubrerythrin
MNRAMKNKVIEILKEEHNNWGFTQEFFDYSAARIDAEYSVGMLTSAYEYAIIPISFRHYTKAIHKLYGEKPQLSKLTKCYNCGEMVEMISSGEFCPKCKC